VSLDKRLPLFLHIPKTAGTTLSNCIYDNYSDPSGNVDDAFLAEGIYYYPAGFMETVEDPALGSAARVLAQSNIHAVVGHFRFGIHRYVARPFTYLTILRHPVARTVSLFHHVRRFGHSEFHHRVIKGDLSLEEFVRDLRFLEVDNGQTRRLSGLEARFGNCSATMLSAAARNLDQHFSVVGVQERFDESLLMIQRTLGWGSVQYLPGLVDSARASEPPLPDATRNAILERNELDLQLYAHAVEMLDEWLSAQDPDFVSELQYFRAANEEHIRRWASDQGD
jgi:Galactose-3-O-sulfotransferase